MYTKWAFSEHFRQAVHTVATLQGLLDSEDGGTNIFRNVGSSNQSTQRNIPEDLSLNPLNTKLNPISHLLALLGAHHILHVSRVRVNFLIL